MRYTVLKKKKQTLVDSIWGTIPELALWPPHEHTFVRAHTHACWHTRIPTNQITVIHLYELLLYQTLLDYSILYIKTLQISKLRIWQLGQRKSNWTIELGSSKLRGTDVTPQLGWELWEDLRTCNIPQKISWCLQLRLTGTGVSVFFFSNLLVPGFIITLLLYIYSLWGIQHFAKVSA